MQMMKMFALILPQKKKHQDMMVRALIFLAVLERDSTTFERPHPFKISPVRIRKAGMKRNRTSKKKDVQNEGGKGVEANNKGVKRQGANCKCWMKKQTFLIP